MAKLKTPKQIFPIALITWEDITEQSGGWVKDHPIEPCLMSSVGYLIVDQPDYIVYASDLAQDGTTNGRTQVPRVNVKSVKILRKVPSERKKDSLPVVSN